MENNTPPIITVRMFKTGTGDFFLIRITKNDEKFHILLDCGSFRFNKEKLKTIISQIREMTHGLIDLLIDTHDHADHINGFKLGATDFKDFEFKKVWFAWTENPNDKLAGELRHDFSASRFAIAHAYQKLKSFFDNQEFVKSMQGERSLGVVKELESQFHDSMGWLNQMNGAAEKQEIPLKERFEEYGIIRKDTIVQYREPGETIDDLIGGIRFYILGPPKNLKQLNDEGRSGDFYKKRETASQFRFEWINALMEPGSAANKPFDPEYELKDVSYKKKYAEGEEWRKIDADWLMNVSNMAIRFERCLNNTSLAFAIEVKETGRVLLFTGDAEYGNWDSWVNNTWGKKIDVKALLNNTVFYKVGHHLSQNGTPWKEGLELIPGGNLTAMASLDLDVIHSNWKRTMPCQELTANLIIKSKGNMYFTGDYQRILQNIDTSCIPGEYLEVLEQKNKSFEEQNWVEAIIK